MEVDWQAITERLVQFSQETLAAFATEYPAETCSFIAIAVDFPSFFFSLDTPDNGLRVAQQTEQEALARRAKMLTLPTAWETASAFLAEPPVLDYSYDSSLFAYESYSQLRIDALEDLGLAEDYPRNETGEDFAEGNTRIVLWRVIERLIAGGALQSLRLASPCRVGYHLHDEPLTVLRIVNWPTPQ